MKNHRQPLKRFSQNFLVNPFHQKRIVDALEIHPEDVVVEIGPGHGALSQHVIAAKPKSYVAVEIDTRWAEELRQKFGDSLQILNTDFMAIDPAEICEKHGGQILKIIGNLPYHITSPILFRLIDHYRIFHSAVIMTQKEVARRITARPGGKDYGILSISSQSYAKAEYLFEITRGNFSPPPSVDSAVVKLTFFSALEGVADEQLYRRLIRNVFNYRRKMLRNSLSSMMEITSEELAGIDLTRRPESLAIDEFKQLANEISEKLNR